MYMLHFKLTSRLHADYSYLTAVILFNLVRLLRNKSNLQKLKCGSKIQWSAKEKGPDSFSERNVKSHSH